MSKILLLPNIRPNSAIMEGINLKSSLSSSFFLIFRSRVVILIILFLLPFYPSISKRLINNIMALIINIRKIAAMHNQRQNKNKKEKELQNKADLQVYTYTCLRWALCGSNTKSKKYASFFICLCALYFIQQEKYVHPYDQPLNKYAHLFSA